jgi:hypothetical protein
MVGSVDSSSTPSDFSWPDLLFLIDAIHRLRRCLKGAFGSLARCSSLKSRAQSYCQPAMTRIKGIPCEVQEGRKRFA